ncbi:probable serine/threonine-protein kinase tsuA [Anopheles nili]|uniref:probable serine/threonine-protein kinase tsuA n=1 Tax=Anopheles nili TaxID=185578 RepID=UPI00237AA138|nr:probable serine/threonine-protein kinase tsuA [Anopheles nili]
MHMLDLISDIAMASSSSQMEISEPFRTEDLSKTDFFDFVTGSAPDMAISSSSSGGGGPGGGGPGGGGPGGANNGTSCQRLLSGGLPSMNTGVRDRPPGSGRHANDGTPMDGSPASRIPDANDQPLQGFDQFWGSDKDANRLDPTMFEDLNRYCWVQQNNNNTTTSNNNNNNNNTTNNGNNNSPNNGSNSNNGGLSNQVADTDGQIYTLTVLNGAPEPWVLRKDPNGSEPTAPASNLDLDTILGGFPGYVKTECFSYDDSGFGTDHHAKDDQHHQHQQQQQHLLVQQQQQQTHLAQPQSQLQQVQTQQQQQMPVTSSNIVLSSNLLDPNSVLAYQNNNNNDWQMSDHNVIQQDTAESLLRSALQGKGYTKGVAGLQLPNGAVTVLPTPGHMKDDELRRVLYSTGDPADSLGAYADSTLAGSIYDEQMLHSPVSSNPSVASQQQHQQQLVVSTGQVQDLGGGGPGAASGSVVVDDMFLTLDAAFPEDYEKLKRIATEVQQFCTDNNNYAEIIVETPTIGNGCGNSSSTGSLLSGQPHHHHGTLAVLSPTTAPGLSRQPASTTTSSDVVTTTSTAKVKAPRAKKSYKRSLGAMGGNLASTTNTASSVASNNNNNNNTSMSNLNTIAGGTLLSPGAGTGTSGASTTGPSTTTATSAATTSPTQCGNGQRKERSLHYCSICSKGFKDKYSVNVHIRTHTGEKPFACSLCGKSFRQKAHLAKHYQTHLAQKNPGPGGAVTKQSKQSRLSTVPLVTEATPVNNPAGPPVSLPAVTNLPGSHPPLATPTQSPPMLLTNTNTATIVVSR